MNAGQSQPNAAPPTPWAASELGLPETADGPERRLAVLRTLREYDFVPPPAQAVALRAVAAEKLGGLAWLDPQETEVEKLRRELKFLARNIRDYPVGDSAIAELSARCRRFAFARNSLKQIELARRLQTPKIEGESADFLRNELLGWLSKSPADLADARLAWLDEDLEERRNHLENLKSSAPQFFAAVPGFDHYSNPRDPVLEPGASANWDFGTLRPGAGVPYSDRNNSSKKSASNPGLWIIAVIILTAVRSCASQMEDKPKPVSPNVVRPDFRSNINRLNADTEATKAFLKEFEVLQREQAKRKKDEEFRDLLKMGTSDLKSPAK